jgi:hypothetical protein
MQWPSPIMTPKPTILVNSIEDAAFSENLISLKVAEEATGGMHVEATLNNWGTVKRVLGFLFSESSNFILGNPFEVKVQGASMFTGLIIRLAESSSPGLPPQLNLEA